MDRPVGTSGAFASRSLRHSLAVSCACPRMNPWSCGARTQAYHARKRALNEQMAAMHQSLEQLSKELSLTSPLVEQGVMSEVELLRLRRQYADMQSHMAERRNRYLTDASNEWVRIESELAQTRENTLAREDAFKKTVIRSPMEGIVKNVQQTTLGAVIQSGQSILEIVPVKDDMLVEAYVKPSEVAFLKVNQAAVVKLTAYDFNKYGGLEPFWTTSALTPCAMKTNPQSLAVRRSTWKRATTASWFASLTSAWTAMACA
ncbi:putative type I secretion system membrane fusion protein PrsE-like [Daphnia sinensis]|uniref:Type I secretion system membrane fusion protein PrsE-like n=1 Tax=Daphnia sinensis TaxID=1820382 RepID=A0AAD5PM84_9CRUS|nr:putative type I secretion system membrane fusion protein PrsE-like [Daphnia sinensis]